MPDLRTLITEVGTGLGLLGQGSLDEVLDRAPTEMVSLSPDVWDQLRLARAGGAFDREFAAAFDNGAAFLAAESGLRGRPPLLVEWKGSQRAPGDEVAPVDLRVDHVYLISCKYLSKVLANGSPRRLFDDLLAGRQGRRSGDWFAEVAPAAYDALYQAVRHAVSEPQLPTAAVDLTTADRQVLRESLRGGWPDGTGALAAELVDQVATASAERWRRHLGTTLAEHEAMLWRLLRMGGAPYFVLGTSARESLRLRIATPWDWRQRFRLASLDIEPEPGGQARVAWRAVVHDRNAGVRVGICGHVEVRWSHGPFGGHPEAKVYLDTPHGRVPGYFPLDGSPTPLAPLDPDTEPALRLFG